METPQQQHEYSGFPTQVKKRKLYVFELVLEHAHESSLWSI